MKSRKSKSKQSQFLCVCDFCQEPDEEEDQTIERLISGISKLQKERQTAYDSTSDNEERYRLFPAKKCKRLMNRYRMLYKLGSDKGAQPFYLYHVALDGYSAAYWFHELCSSLEDEQEKLVIEINKNCNCFCKCSSRIWTRPRKGIRELR